MAKFPSNPEDGMIIEVSKGHFYLYDKNTNSWNRLPGLDRYDLASQQKSGLMSKEDFAKINELIVPPPQTTIKGEQCDFTYQDGEVALYSGDDIIKIDDKLATYSGDVQLANNQWNLHFNTDGIDWTIDLDKLFEELDERGKLVQRAVQGDPGEKGDTGDSGRDELDTGPQGEKGADGLNAPWRGTAIPEAIKLEALNPNSNKAIVDITTEQTSDGNYLVVKRANIGAVGSTTDKVNVEDFGSPWLMVIDFKPSSAQKVITGTNCNEKLVCRFSESSVYYLNIDPILQAFEDRFQQVLAQTKQAKEQVIIGWLKNMITMFNQQKSAICCALENCKSKGRNSTERKYIEQQRIQAAQADLNISLDSDRKEIIDMNVDKTCVTSDPESSFSSVTYGDEDDCFDCVVKVVLDGVENAGTSSRALSFDLEAGEYVVTIDDCCVNNSVINDKWHAKINITYSRQTVSTGGNGPVLDETITVPDCGVYSDRNDAQNAYLGQTLQISHAGGSVHAWIPDTYAQDNEGFVSLCFRKLECFDVDAGSDDALEDFDDVIYVYKNQIEDANYLGAILPFVGNEDATTNYGYGAGTDPTGPAIVNGCEAASNESAFFFYDGSDGLTFFTLNGNENIASNTVSYSYETINGTGSMSVIVSDDSGELSPSVIQDSFVGNWTQDGDGDGGVIGYYDRRTDAPWIFKVTPTNPGSIDLLKICSRDGGDIYLPAPTGKQQNAFSAVGNINYYDNPTGGLEFAAGDGLKFAINGAVGFGGALRGPSGGTTYSNRTTLSADGQKLNEPFNEATRSAQTNFYVGQYFLYLQKQGFHFDGPPGLVMRFEFDDGTVEEIQPLTNKTVGGAEFWGYESPPAIVSNDQTLLAQHNAAFPDSPMCDPTEYANESGTGGWATRTPFHFYGKPSFEKYCQRLVVSYLRMKKSGKVYFYVNDAQTESSQGFPAPPAIIVSGGNDIRTNVGQYDILIEQCEAENFDSVLNPVPDRTYKGSTTNVAWTTPFCESGDSDDSNVPSTIVFTKLRDGCSMVWQKIEWYERGWRTGNCCGVHVEINGQRYLVVKRSLGVDMSCGGGETLAEDCIRTHINGVGHPAIAWPTIDGDEFFGRPTSGSTTFVYDKDLSNEIIRKISQGDILDSKGNRADITAILFPKID